MRVEFNEVESTLSELFGDEEILAAQSKCFSTQVMLRVRNVMVVLAAVLFLASFAFRAYAVLRAVGYLFGALAYICEIFVLTDCFQVKIPHNELFMPYCFGPLYLIMGVGYLVG